MSRYLLTDEATQDLAEIRHYVRDESGPRAALHVTRKISEAFLFLSRVPGAGHVREDLTSEPFRFWPIFSYLIVYNPIPRPTVVIRVLHGRRNTSAVLHSGS